MLISGIGSDLCSEAATIGGAEFLRFGRQLQEIVTPFDSPVELEGMVSRCRGDAGLYIRHASGREFWAYREDCDKPWSQFTKGTNVVFIGKPGTVPGEYVARKVHRNVFLGAYGGIPNQLKAFVIPRDKNGAIKHGNIDCMNFMVRADLAKKYVNSWNDEFAADWFFIERLLQEGVKFKFIDRIIADKF